MKIGQDILDYQGELSDHEAEIGAAIIKLISKALPKAEGKVWHGHQQAKTSGSKDCC